MYFVYIAVTLIVLVILISAAQRYGLKMPQVALEEKHQKYILLGIGGVVLIAVLGVLASYSTLGVSFWIPAFLVVMLAVLGVLGKAGVIGKLAGWFVGLLLFGYLGLHIMYGNEFNEVVKVKQKNFAAHAKGEVTSEASVPQVVQPAPVTPRTILGEAKWDKLAEDGSLPVGVWSRSIYLDSMGNRCTIHFDAGNGIIYKVRYQLYNTGWVEHVPKPKNDVVGDEVQYMMLKEGIKKVPVRTKCPQY